MARVELRGVVKRFDEQVVIHALELDVADGEFVVIVGPSGCGKSTLLRCVAGLKTVSEGDIRIGGRSVTGLEPGERNVAMVFQNYALYPHMSVFDNMAYGLKIRRLPKAEIAERVQRAAGILGLEDLLARKPRQLSGGQRQRVAMGRAIVREPEVFLFDEPLSNLDAKLRGQMRIELQQLHRRLATTSLYVTHDQVEAMTLANRIVVMNAGRVEQIGAPAEVYARPASRFVAGFIGSPAMNFLEGRLGEDALALNGGGAVALPGALTAALRGRELALGIRPEHLVRCAPGEAMLQATVELLEHLGADTIVHARIGPQPLLVRLAQPDGLAPGAALALRAAPEALHWFACDTGRRID